MEFLCFRVQRVCVEGCQSSLCWQYHFIWGFLMKSCKRYFLTVITQSSNVWHREAIKSLCIMCKKRASTGHFFLLCNFKILLAMLTWGNHSLILFKFRIDSFFLDIWIFFLYFSQLPAVDLSVHGLWSMKVTLVIWSTFVFLSFCTACIE